MGDLIVPRNVTKAAIGFLKAELAARSVTAAVGTKQSGRTPNIFVKINRTGGTRRDKVTDRSQFTVQVEADDEIVASDVADLCYALMLYAEESTVGGIWVRKVEDVSGPKDFPDPDTNKPRYQFTVRWHTRGQSV